MEQGRLIPGWLFPAFVGLAFSALVLAQTPKGAEVDFRGNDRDWNHVNDFWTSNVAGLYTMTSAQVGNSFLAEAVCRLNRCLEHFENPSCSHPVKDWPQQSCPLRIYWTNVD